jgi:ABC-type antimicrobial peptide transport system permease subunit
VLKTLGFSSAHVMSFVVGEALLLGVLGGALGVFGSQGLLYTLSHTPGIADLLAGIGLSGIELKPAVALLGFFIAVVLGLFAGFVPAVSAYRARITDILRTV